jgi:hypothetical protein
VIMAMEASLAFGCRWPDFNHDALNLGNQKILLQQPFFLFYSSFRIGADICRLLSASPVPAGIITISKILQERVQAVTY